MCCHPQGNRVLNRGCRHSVAPAGIQTHRRRYAQPCALISRSAVSRTLAEPDDTPLPSYAANPNAAELKSASPTSDRRMECTRDCPSLPRDPGESPRRKPGPSATPPEPPEMYKSRQKWTAMDTFWYLSLCIAPQIGHFHFRSTNRFRRDCPVVIPT